jgi:hypothetical protein
MRWSLDKISIAPVSVCTKQARPETALYSLVYKTERHSRIGLLLWKLSWTLRVHLIPPPFNICAGWLKSMVEHDDVRWIHVMLSNWQTSKKNYVGGLFCDLQMAFDFVNHNVLVEKMNFYRISGTAIKLMTSYLENRYQRIIMRDIKLNKVFSKWERVKHGVPQGSIFGPLLFLIYINDFTFSLQKLAQPILFADDTSIIISNSSPKEFRNIIISVFNEKMTWFNKNFLQVLLCPKGIVQLEAFRM